MADTEVVEREPRHRPGVGWVLTGATAVLLAVVMLHLPRGAYPLPAVARYALTTALPQWRTTEPVSEVVYGTRGFDTFGETFLLLAAVVAVSVLSRAKERRRGFVGEEAAGHREQREVDPPEPTGGRQRTAEHAEEQESGEEPASPSDPDGECIGAPGPERAETMTVVMRAGVRFLAPVLATAGLYLVAWGYSPGGGFPAGAAMLGVALLAYVSLGYRRVEPVLRPEVVEPLELAGALVIVAIGVLGLVLAGSFLANFLPLAPPQTIRSGGTLQAFSVTEFVEVGTGLVLAVFGLLGMRDDWSAEEDR